MRGFIWKARTLTIYVRSNNLKVLSQQRKMVVKSKAWRPHIKINKHEIFITRVIHTQLICCIWCHAPSFVSIKKRKHTNSATKWCQDNVRTKSSVQRKKRREMKRASHLTMDRAGVWLWPNLTCHHLTTKCQTQQPYIYSLRLKINIILASWKVHFFKLWPIIY